MSNIFGRRNDSQKISRPKTKRLISRKWASPFVMIFCFALGIVLALGHHFYYRWLDGSVVGDLTQQQWSFRFGNFFAVATATVLKLAMANACMQYIWLRLRQQHHKLETIDAAFSMTGDISSFFHTDLYKSMYIGVILAILIWVIPIAGLFPPATLSVVLDVHSDISTFDALQPSIAAPDPVNQYGTDVNETFDSAYLAPPDTFATLVKSVAYAGQITPPQPLIAASNYSYTLTTYIPRFKCAEDPSGSHSQILEAAQEVVLLLHPSNGTSFNKDTFEYVNGEFEDNGIDNAGDGQVFYLGLATLAGTKLEDDDLATVGLPDSQTIFSPLDSGSNSMSNYWIRDAISGSVIFVILTGPDQFKFANCAFYNSSFETETSFANGIGTTRVLSVTDVAEIRNFSASVGSPTSYFHYFQEMAKLFVGGIIAEDTTESLDEPDVFKMPLSVVPTESTILAGADDFSAMLQYRADWVGGSNNNTRAPQNKSFAVLLDELSVNVSLSLMSSPSLCRTVSVTGEIHTLFTVYRYQPMNLLISYGVAIVCSLVSIIVGFTAYYQNGTSHDSNVSTIGAMAQNPELAGLLRRPVDYISSDREDDQGYRQIMLKLDTYAIAEIGDEKRRASDDSTKPHKRRYVGFVTDEY